MRECAGRFQIEGRQFRAGAFQLRQNKKIGSLVQQLMSISYLLRGCFTRMLKALTFEKRIEETSNIPPATDIWVPIYLLCAVLQVCTRARFSMWCCACLQRCLCDIVQMWRCAHMNKNVGYGGGFKTFPFRVEVQRTVSFWLMFVCPLGSIAAFVSKKRFSEKIAKKYWHF